ncbi:GAF domain-containing protein [Clostridium tyrobutyricum]|uniref:GAF domain-containing protein n=1 Tax=Clostridium tyrobutyricum TaxID=1519 RepID=UPI00073D656A|nr:GAF domain-containing protein [Clostridium tyrobutyricum]
MDDAMKAVLSLFSPTAVLIIEIIVIIAIVAICVLLVISAYKYTKSVAKETKIFDLSKKNYELHNKLSDAELINSNILNSLNTLTSFLYNSQLLIFNSVENGNEIEIGEQFKIMANLISSDTGGNDRKRVSLWVFCCDENEEPVLRSFYRSANYTNYNSDTKCLPIDDSIAGRAFRKNKKEFIYDLENDPDWHGFSGNQIYSAILAIPIKNFGVLTVDFSSKPSKYELQIIEFYCYNMALLNAAAYQSYKYCGNINNEGEDNQDEEE